MNEKKARLVDRLFGVARRRGGARVIMLRAAMLFLLAAAAGVQAQPVATSTATVAEVPGTWSLAPTGLNTGDAFRLLFLSSTKRNATSTDIAVYNTFVQDRAASGHTDIRAYSAGFRAVGCTASTDAIDNTGTATSTATSVPIYWLNGNRVAHDYADFYDGSWAGEANDRNESGHNGLDTSNAGNYPLTGCDHDGTEYMNASDISFALGEDDVRVARPNSSATNAGPLSSNSAVADTSDRPMYGLSGVFQVTGTTTAGVLVSNTNQAQTATGSLLIGQGFATGNHPGGYLIDSIGIGVVNVSSTLRVRLFGDQGTNPSGSLAVFTRPAVVASSTVNRFASPGGVGLKANKNYYVVVDNDDGTRGDYSLQLTSHNGQVSPGGDGWGIRDGNRHRNNPNQNWNTSPNSLIIDVRGATNNAATGTVTVVGTAVVGEELRAAVSGVADLDGLTHPDYAYAWLRVDGGVESVIGGTATSTYTVVIQDEGRELKARVRFADDTGFPEQLTSAARAVSAPPRTVRFATSTYTAAEGGAAAQVTVELSPAPTSAMSIRLTTDEGGGANSSDSIVQQNVEFSATETSKTFPVTAVDDSDDDDGEFVTLGFGAPLPAGVTVGSPATARVDLVDNDTEPVTLSRVLNVRVTPEAEALSLIWDAVPGAAGYEVQWKGSGQGYDPNARQQTTTNATARIADLTGAATYAVRVRARTGSVTGEWSAEVTGRTQLAARDPVLTLHGIRTSVRANEHAEIEVRRRAQPGAGVDLSGDLVFRITMTRRVGGVDWTGGLRGTIRRGRTQSTISWPAEDLETSYTTRLTLDEDEDEYVLGSPSSLTIRVSGTRNPPGPVTGLTVTPAYRQLDLSWSPVSGANSYRVSWDPREGSGATYRDGTTSRIRGLTAGRSYTVGVRAVRQSDDAEGEALEAAGTPLSLPLTVQGVTATAVAGGLDVGWTRTADARSYEVQWKTSGQGYIAGRSATVTRPAHRIRGLAAATYTVRVRGQTAVNPTTSGDIDGIAGGWSAEATGAVAASAMSPPRVLGNVLTMRYSELLDAGSVPSARDFVVQAGPPAGAAPVAVDTVAVETVSVRSDTVVLMLARPVTATERVRLTYLEAAMHPLRDTHGTLAAPLTDVAVRNETPAVVPGALQGVLELGAALEALHLVRERVDLGALLSRAERESVAHLDLSFAGLADLGALRGLTGLRELNLGGNAVVDVGALSGLTDLRVLDLSSNAIADVGPLSSLTGLRRLDLSANSIVDVSALSGLTGLEVLLLDGNRIADVVPLWALQGLVNLGLSGNRIADVGLLAELGALQRLDLSGNRLADVSPLGDLSGLVWLRLPGNAVVDASPLGRLTVLRWLWLDATTTGIEALTAHTQREVAPLQLGGATPVRAAQP